MIDAFDDLALPKKEFKVVAVIPVHGRLELLPHTIGRLYKKNGVHTVICVGDGEKEKIVCTEAGAVWVPHQNKPLGAKWNKGFKAARELHPDAVLYVGSSDWLSDSWLTVMQPYVNQHQMAGVPGMHLLDIGTSMRVCKWAGYTNGRRNETIGIGRVISAQLLNKIDWMPFDDTKDNSMDRCMKDKAAAVGVNDHFVRDERLVALSISTNKWPNKHSFEQHWANIMPSEKIFQVDDFLKDFPEAYQVF